MIAAAEAAAVASARLAGLPLVADTAEAVTACTTSR
jgi:hypothetical protein